MNAAYLVPAKVRDKRLQLLRDRKVRAADLGKCWTGTQIDGALDGVSATTVQLRAVRR